MTFWNNKTIGYDDTGEKIRTRQEQQIIDAALIDIERYHDIYRETLKSFIASCKEKAVYLGKAEIEVAMEGIGEALADTAEHSIQQLDEFNIAASYTPDDEKQLIEAAYNELLEACKPKPIKWDEVANMFKALGIHL